MKKTKRLNSKGIFLIRVREEGLNEIDGEFTKNIFCIPTGKDFQSTIKEIVFIIKNYINDHKIAITSDELMKINNFKLTENKFEDDKIKILNQYRTNYIVNNLTKTCLIRLWDYEKNKDIIPQKVAPNDDISIWFTCKYGFSRRINVKSITSKHLISCDNSQNCKNCQSIYCPLVLYCNRWYRRTNPCVQTLKYYYYRLVHCNQKHDDTDQLTYYNEDIYRSYINCQAEVNDDNFYEPSNLYNFYKNKNIPDMLTKIFRKSELSMKNFNSFEDFHKFITYWKPEVCNIKYKDFDKEELRDEFLSNLYDYVKYQSYWLLKLKDEDMGISDEMVNSVLKILRRVLSTKSYEYKEIVENNKKFLLENRVVDIKK